MFPNGLKNASDKQLLNQIATGNVKAFRHLMLTYEPLVFNFVFKLVKSGMVAEEITQDVFLKIWERAADFAHVESLSAWLYTMGRNHAYNKLKEHAARRLREQDYADNQKQICDLEDQIHEKELSLLVHELVDQLPPQRKLIFKLKTEKGMTVDEIGQFLDLSPYTVRNQLTKSYGKIRKLLTEHACFLLIGLLINK
ncbi:RNA polymerase sigma-70 factor [Olivibacter sp. LS-1]|uniref:RNA polymerase sigma factor n=1 Tax=Olivibacter sp. LS-1 TaxID=2592345 RepID=UPI0011EB581A|nr:RNA polymerase sigma-70 factor [Olivibacter sp. LS-1]QEL03433.1 RNA polymerase sigma-70 factor [Olivibacter sp. LS-1]